MFLHFCSLSSKRNIFTATHSVFLHQIDRGALPSTRRGFFPAYRMGIGKNYDMVGKIPTWWEKFRHGGKNSDMVRIKDKEGYMKA
jgi:hypothetical protein